MLIRGRSARILQAGAAVLTNRGAGPASNAARAISGRAWQGAGTWCELGASHGSASRSGGLARVLGTSDGRGEVTGEGSDATFDAFCAAAYPRLVAALGHVVGDRAVAEELAQEALVRAHQRWGRVSELDSPLGWTVHVGTNLARSHLRRRVLARRIDRQLAATAPTEHTDPDPADAIAVREAMAALSLPQREAVALRFVVGLTAVEAGRVLGIEPTAVRARTHRALEVLRGRLAIDLPVEAASPDGSGHCEAEEVRRAR